MKKVSLLFPLVLGLALVLVLTWLMKNPSRPVTAAPLARSQEIDQLKVTGIEEISYTVYLPASSRPYPTSIEDKWSSSGHADAKSNAFTHWDEADPKEIPASCAKCHSTPGFLDFLGEDGTAAGSVDNPAPVDRVVNCDACHNDSAEAMTSVIFPSGVEIQGLGREAHCIQCHQGRESTVSVDNLVGDLEDDEISGSLRFLNVHYFIAGATRYGSDVQGAYEYENQLYVGRFPPDHNSQSCITCHDSHGLWVLLEECRSCHPGVSNPADLKDIRTSLGDFDGDGDQTEGIAGEITTIWEALLPAIQSYATITVGTDIVYSINAYPYFFVDTNGNGEADPDETIRENGYASWTPRLLRAAYNLHWATNDPGAYAHNGRYAIQVLYDSLKDIGGDVSGMIRPTTL